jgi:hypothetical protein
MMFVDCSLMYPDRFLPSHYEADFSGEVKCFRYESYRTIFTFCASHHQLSIDVLFPRTTVSKQSNITQMESPTRQDPPIVRKTLAGPAKKRLNKVLGRRPAPLQKSKNSLAHIPRVRTFEAVQKAKRDARARYASAKEGYSVAPPKRKYKRGRCVP